MRGNGLPPTRLNFFALSCTPENKPFSSFLSACFLLFLHQSNKEALALTLISPELESIQQHSDLAHNLNKV